MKTPRHPVLAWLGPLALAALVAGLFGWTAGAPPMRDDLLVTEENPHASSAGNILRYFVNDLDWLPAGEREVPRPSSRFGLYRPLLAASYHVDAALWGQDFGRWRWTNIGLHLAATLLLLGLAGRLLASRRAALAAALVFALHPLHAEAVSWLLGGRAELLAAVFVLASWWAFAGCELERRRARAMRDVFSAGSFLLALWSKENALVLPAILFLHGWLLERQSAGRVLQRLVPHLVILAAYLALRWLVMGRFGPPVEAPALAPLSGFERLAAIPFLLAWYLRLAALPFPLAPAECYQALPGWFSPAIGVLAGAVLIGSCAVCLWRAVRARAGGHEIVPWVAALLFFVCLGPVAHLVPLPVLVAERFLYLPSVAVCLLLGWAGERLARHRSWLLPAAGIPVLLAFALQTTAVNLRLSDPDLEFAAAARCRPDDPGPVNNLGTYLLRSGKIAEALAAFEQAIAIDPVPAEARYNRALSLQRLGRRQEAIEAYRALLRDTPGHALAQNNLGVLLTEVGDIQAAREAFERAYRSDPAHPAPLLNLAAILQAEGRREEAERLYRTALTADPRGTEARLQLGRLLEASGRRPEAETLYREILALAPGHAMALNNLANLQKDRGEIAAAEENYRAAIAADPRCAPAHYNLATSLLSRGDAEGATRHYRIALDIAPDDVSAWLGLGYSELARGRVQEANEAAARAAALAPEDPRLGRLRSAIQASSAP